MRMTISEWICYLNYKVVELENRNPSGSQFLYGEGTPPSSLGSNGDLYLRFNGGFLYRKEDSMWVRQGKISLDHLDGGEI